MVSLSTFRYRLSIHVLCTSSSRCHAFCFTFRKMVNIVRKSTMCGKWVENIQQLCESIGAISIWIIVLIWGYRWWNTLHISNFWIETKSKGECEDTNRIQLRHLIVMRNIIKVRHIVIVGVVVVVIGQVRVVFRCGSPKFIYNRYGIPLQKGVVHNTLKCVTHCVMQSVSLHSNYPILLKRKRYMFWFLFIWFKRHNLNVVLLFVLLIIIIIIKVILLFFILIESSYYLLWKKLPLQKYLFGYKHSFELKCTFEPLFGINNWLTKIVWFTISKMIIRFLDSKIQLRSRFVVRVSVELSSVLF